MLMTREMDYALRIMRALYQEEQLSAGEIAQREHMPKAVTLKILKQLHAAGLVDSRRGPNGRYLLGKPCEQLNLWELFQAMGSGMVINRCQQAGYQCENRSVEECAMSRELSRIQNVLDQELRRTRLSLLLQEE